MIRTNNLNSFHFISFHSFIHSFIHSVLIYEPIPRFALRPLNTSLRDRRHLGIFRLKLSPNCPILLNFYFRRHVILWYKQFPLLLRYYHTTIKPLFGHDCSTMVVLTGLSFAASCCSVCSVGSVLTRTTDELDQDQSQDTKIAESKKKPLGQMDAR